MVKTDYRKHYGELEGRVSVNYEDDNISGTLYADTPEELYRAVRFLRIRNLDCDKLIELILDKHGDGHGKDSNGEKR